jgi:putative transcriptional regulator
MKCSGLLQTRFSFCDKNRAFTFSFYDLKMKSARVSKDLSQQQLADLIGVSRQTISAIEKGDYNPTINLCIAICKELGRTLDELFWE